MLPWPGWLGWLPWQRVSTFAPKRCRRKGLSGSPKRQFASLQSYPGVVCGWGGWSWAEGLRPPVPPPPLTVTLPPNTWGGACCPVCQLPPSSASGAGLGVDYAVWHLLLGWGWHVPRHLKPVPQFDSCSSVWHPFPSLAPAPLSTTCSPLQHMFLSLTPVPHLGTWPPV